MIFIDDVHRGFASQAERVGVGLASIDGDRIGYLDMADPQRHFTQFFSCHQPETHHLRQIVYDKSLRRDHQPDSSVTGRRAPIRSHRQPSRQRCFVKGPD